MPDILNSLYIAGAGMHAQSQRLQVVSQNIANVDSAGVSPNDDPYRRKVITFKNELDRKMGMDLVEVNKIGYDQSDFKLKYDPSHPAADERGYVKMPNVNSMIELVDMREARRGYEANINVIEVSKSMLSQTINLLR